MQNAKNDLVLSNTGSWVLDNTGMQNAKNDLVLFNTHEPVSGT